MGSVNDLFDLASEWLAACEHALTATPGGLPKRSYVSPGLPPWDCEQLTVHVASPTTADTTPLSPPLTPGHRVQVQGAVNLVVLVATVLRCVPAMDDDGNPPPVADLEQAAIKMDADAWAIWNHSKTAVREGLLFAPKEREVFFDPGVSLVNAGGIAGWQVQIRVALDGFVLS